MSDEWGPWIHHDGLSRPLPKGTYAMVELRSGAIVECVTGMHNVTASGRLVQKNPLWGDAWIWGSGGAWWRPCEVIRYRIRKPRALIQLIEMVENLPAPREVETATRHQSRKEKAEG